MSVSQFDFYVVSASGCEKIQKLNLTWDACQSYLSLDSEIVRLPFKTLVGSLPRLKSWSRDLNRFGEETGNRVDALQNRDRTVEVLIRFDGGEINPSFIRSVIEFCAAIGCKLLAVHGTVLDPNEQSVTHFLSEAWAKRINSLGKTIM